MSGNETTTEYRAVGVYQDGHREMRDEDGWSAREAADATADRWSLKGFGFDRVDIEAREVGPVRVVGTFDVG